MSYPSIFWILHYADQVDHDALWIALREIEQLGDPAIVPQLKPLIHENGPTGKGFRLIALDAAVALDGTAARDIILPMLLVDRTQEKGFSLAAELAKTIGKLATQGVDCTVAVEPLLLFLADDNRVNKLRSAARRALQLEELRDPRLFELLTQALQDECMNLWMRCRIIKVLGRLGDPKGYSLIAPFATADHEYSLRQAAFEALGQLGNPQAFDLVRAGLQDPRPDVEQSAIAALGKLGDDRGAIAIVENMFERQRGCLYEAEKDALRKMGLSAVPQLIRQLKSDASPLLSVMAIECLGEIAQNPDSGTALGLILQPEIDTLLALFKQGNSYEVQQKMSDIHGGAVGSQPLW